MNHEPIGVFDSGVGGLTVLRELASILPQEHFIYLGDTARLPYGNKSPEVILDYAIDNARFLLSQNIKALVIACHTACSYAYEVLKQTLSIPVIGVAEPGCQEILETTRSKKIAILGTSSTIHSGFLQKKLLSQDPTFQIFSVACPLFVPLVEEGFHLHPATKLIVQEYLSPILQRDIDAALLACTHYPILAPTIQEVLGPTVKLIEPARATAISIKKQLESLSLLQSEKRNSTYRFFSTDNPQKFQKLAKAFFPFSLSSVEQRIL